MTSQKVFCSLQIEGKISISQLEGLAVRGVLTVMKWVRVSLCVIPLWQSFLCVTDCTEKFPPFRFTFEHPLIGVQTKSPKRRHPAVPRARVE